MLYVLYLAGILAYILSGIGWHPTDFIDQITGIYILAPCALVLLCTKSFPAFLRSFRLALGKKDVAQEQYEESLQTVRMVMFAALLSGGLCFLIGTINSCRSLSFEQNLTDSMVWLLLDTTVAMLSLFYPLTLCLLLLPLPFLLKKRLLLLKAAAGQTGQAGDSRTGQDDRPQDSSDPQLSDVQPLKCAVVRELLPAYIRDDTSKETDADIQAHLKNCDRCRVTYHKLTKRSAAEEDSM